MTNELEIKIEEKLEVIVRENNIEANEGQLIIDTFAKFFKQAREFEFIKDTLVITDASQTVEMSEAKAITKRLKKCRIDTEKARKSFKEGYLNKGRAVDMMAKLVNSMVEPLEDYFESQVKFAENIEKAKKNEVIKIRKEELSKYTEDLSVYNFELMTEVSYSALLFELKDNFDKKQAELKAIEDERIAKEKAEKEEAEKNKVEVERLKNEAEARELEIAKEKAEQAEKERLLHIQIEKEQAERKEEIRKEKEARVELERKERERLLEEQRLKEEKEKEERDAKLAPEKDKLTLYAESIRTIKAPEDLSKAGQAIVAEVEKDLLAISQKIKEQLKNL